MEITRDKRREKEGRRSKFTKVKLTLNEDIIQRQ
jgi:hypothetical protein